MVAPQRYACVLVPQSYECGLIWKEKVFADII